MRARLIVVTFGVALIGAACAIQACSSAAPAEPVAVTPDAEAGVEAGPAIVDAGCNLATNLLDEIPDAQIADGASTSGICISCANAKCATAVGECNANCGCKGTAAKGLECYLQNTDNPLICAQAFTTGSVDIKLQAIAFKLLTCINANCKEGCATAGFQPDAGE